MVVIKIQNVDEVERFMINLPKRIERELTRTNTAFMERVMKSAKDKAPVDTGSLKESIKLLPVRKGKNVKKWQLVVSSPYALFQEEGFTPHAFYANPSRGFKSTYLSSGFTFFVSKWTPFVKPAINEQIKTFPNKLNTAMRRAIKK